MHRDVLQCIRFKSVTRVRSRNACDLTCDVGFNTHLGWEIVFLWRGKMILSAHAVNAGGNLGRVVRAPLVV